MIKGRLVGEIVIIIIIIYFINEAIYGIYDYRYMINIGTMPYKKGMFSIGLMLIMLIGLAAILINRFISIVNNTIKYIRKNFDKMLKY